MNRPNNPPNSVFFDDFGGLSRHHCWHGYWKTPSPCIAQSIKTGSRLLIERRRMLLYGTNDKIDRAS
jgi:hypothetical protein